MRARLLHPVVLAAALSFGCTDLIDHGATPCRPDTCDGCCTARGVCLSGDSLFACGSGGVACLVCGGVEQCVAGACVEPSPDLGDAGTDGGDSACGPSSCEGCCENGACRSIFEQTAQRCGVSGASCQACAAGASCSAGVCLAPSVCDLRTSVLTVGNVGQLDFGKAPVGATSRIDVELTNAGTAPCSISAPVWDGSADRNAFGFDGLQAGAAILQPGATLRFPVSFTPYTNKTWSDLSNAFTYTASDNAQSQCVSGERGCRRVVVLGEGVASGIVPSAPIVPTSIDFGQVQTSCESGWRAVYVINESAQALTLSQAAVTGQGFEVSSAALPQSVPAWGTATVRVRFVPPQGAGAGSFSGTLELKDDVNKTTSLPLQAQVITQGGRTETFVQRFPAEADVLFVVHNGSTMAAMQEALATDANVLMQDALSAGGAWRLGAITSDATQANAGRLQGSPKYVTSGTASSFANNVRLGTLGTLDQSFETARLALTPPIVDDPLRNGGFRRPDARLGIVVVTDSNEKSAGAVDDYARAFAAAAGVPLGSERLRLWAISAGGCASGSRYLSASALVGGGCRSLVGSTLQDALHEAGQDLFQTRREFALWEPWDAAQPVAVTVDGFSVPYGYGFVVDSAKNAVRFFPGYVPEPGQQVDVTYSPLCHP